MHPSILPDRTSHPARWRAALVSTLAIAAVAGTILVGIPHQRVSAETPAPTVTLPNGAPTTFADLVERVKPSVVSIQVTSQGPKVARDSRGAPGGRNRGDGPFGQLPDDLPWDLFKKFGREIVPRPVQSQGSGFVISADGYVVTNNHVVADAGKVQIIFDPHHKYDGEIIGTDERTDLALLKIKANGKTFQPVRFAAKEPRVGDWVLAVGNPFGFAGTVTAGIVSAYGRDIGSGAYDYMQIDAAVNKGNSGGPSFNLQGEVVGVNSAIYSPTGTSAGIAFAIPASTASDIITQLKANHSVKRGWLGVRIQSVDDDMAVSLGLPEAKGAVIAQVSNPGPANEAGLKRGDTILAVNGKEIADSRDLARQIASYAPGTSVEIKFLRAQKEQATAVKLGLLPSNQEIARGETPERPSKPTELGQLGFSVSVASAQGRDSEPGVVVTDIDNNSDVAQRIRVGDVIVEADHKPVASPEDLINVVKDANQAKREVVLLLVKSGNETRFEPVRLKRG